MSVEPVATAQGQVWDPERYARDARFVAEWGGPVLDMLAPRPGERILDLGCGDGVLTEEIADRGAIVIGVDASAEQVAAARQRGLDARVIDGAKLDFQTEFNAVFSNAALHWMRPPEAVIAGVWRALRPGGRFIAEMGAEGNVGSVREALWAALERRGIDAAAIDPWYFPTLEDYRGRLEAQGFHIGSIERMVRPTPVAAGMDAWLETFAVAFTSALPAAERPALIAEVVGAVRERLQQGDGWVVDYVRLRFAVRRPGP